VTSRRIPIPLTFFIAILATIFLIIFFADGRDNTLAFGYVGGSSSLNPDTSSTSDLPGLEVSALEESNADGEGDSWWEKGFLKACPFH
jgi:hypothetical protein